MDIKHTGILRYPTLELFFFAKIPFQKMIIFDQSENTFYFYFYFYLIKIDAKTSLSMKKKEKY